MQNLDPYRRTQAYWIIICILNKSPGCFLCSLELKKHWSIMGRKITEHLAQLKHFILSTSDTGLISEKVLNF